MKTTKQFSHKEILIILTIILCNLIIPACNQNSSPKLPAELIGTWVTEDTPYTDRSIEIYDDFILFETGNNASFTLMINNITINVMHKGTLEWTLLCTDLEGSSSTIIMLYKPAKENSQNIATIQLKNIKKITWYKIY